MFVNERIFIRSAILRNRQLQPSAEFVISRSALMKNLKEKDSARAGAGVGDDAVFFFLGSQLKDELVNFRLHRILLLLSNSVEIIFALSRRLDQGCMFAEEFVVLRLDFRDLGVQVIDRFLLFLIREFASAGSFFFLVKFSTICLTRRRSVAKLGLRSKRAVVAVLLVVRGRVAETVTKSDDGDDHDCEENVHENRKPCLLFGM